MDSKITAQLTASITAHVLKQFKAEQKALTLAKCHKYAQFFQHISASHANAIFWTLFVFSIILLATASLLWSSQDKHHNNFHRASLDEENHHDLTTLERKKRKSHNRVVLASVLCFLLALPSVIAEAFAGMAITFCHREDTPFLYWGVFFLLSVGSLIAIMGLSFGIVFSHRRPPWNLKLGTPVLVIAGLVHIAWDGCRDAVRKARGLESKRNDPAFLSRRMTSRSVLSPNSQTPSAWQAIQPNVEMLENVKLIGTFPDTGVRIVSLVPAVDIEKCLSTVSAAATMITVATMNDVTTATANTLARTNTVATTLPDISDSELEELVNAMVQQFEAISRRDSAVEVSQ